MANAFDVLTPEEQSAFDTIANLRRRVLGTEQIEGPLPENAAGPFQPPATPGPVRRVVQGLGSALTGNRLIPLPRNQRFRDIRGLNATPEQAAAFDRLSTVEKAALLTQRPEDLVELMAAPKEEFDRRIQLLGLEPERPPLEPQIVRPGEELVQGREVLRRNPARITVQPGEAVIDDAGNELFSLPKTAQPQTVTLSPGQILVDKKTGRRIATGLPASAGQQGPVILGPGQQAFDPGTGAPIASVPAAQPAPTVLGPGDVAIDRGGAPLAGVPGRPVVVQPGQSLVSPEGQPLLTLEPLPGTGQKVLSPGQELFDAEGNRLGRVPLAPTTLGPGEQLQDPNTGRALTTTQPSIVELGPQEQAVRISPQGAETLATNPAVRGPQVVVNEPNVGSKAREEANEASQRLAAKASTIQEMVTTLQRVGPGAVGVRGAVTAELGGFLSQINEGLGQFTAQGISGARLEDVQEFQTQATEFVARSITLLSGEESGRFTEPERAITETATALKNMRRGYPQTLGALHQLWKTTLIMQDVEARIGGQAEKYDLETEEGRRGWATEQIKNGTPVAVAGDALRAIRRQRRLMARAGAGQAATSPPSPSQGTRRVGSERTPR